MKIQMILNIKSRKKGEDLQKLNKNLMKKINNLLMKNIMLMGNMTKMQQNEKEVDHQNRHTKKMMMKIIKKNLMTKIIKERDQTPKTRMQK